MMGGYVPDCDGCGVELTKMMLEKNLTNWTDNLSGSLAPGRGMSPTPICVGYGSAVQCTWYRLFSCNVKIIRE